MNRLDLGKLSKEEIDNLPKEKIDEIYKSLTEEDKKRLEKKTEMLSKIYPYILIAQVASKNPSEASLKDVMILGVMTEEYCKEFGCSLFDFMEEMNAFQTIFIEKSIEAGIGFDEKHYKVPSILKEKNAKNWNRDDSSNKKSDSNTKKNNTPPPYTLGDLMKSKGIIH